jgi:hypothetical protein
MVPRLTSIDEPDAIAAGYTDDTAATSVYPPFD